MKRILSLLLSVSLCLGLCMTAHAAGDPNIDTGGGGLDNGSAGNIWYGDSGVRVTIIEVESKRAVTTPVDYIKPPEYLLAWNKSNIAHFGKVSKVLG